MLSAKDVSLVFETLLSSPGMSDPVKISLHIPRKNVLLLSMLLERGLSVKDESAQPGLWGMVDQSTLEAIQAIAGELLQKAGLTQMKDKLDALNSK